MKKYLAFSSLFFYIVSWSQLPQMTLNVISTNETCIRNGTIIANLSNTATGAVLSYEVFRIPELNIPISISQITEGLTAGTYKVVAKQMLSTTQGVLSNFEEQTIVVADLLADLKVTIASINTGNCGVTTAAMEITTSSGNPVSYEIIAGPVLRPPQTSNIFIGLPTGLYQFKVIDSCGSFIRPQYTHIVAIPRLEFVNNQISQLVDSCTSTSINAGITIVNSAIITYPLKIVFTVTSPSGASVTTTETINNGNASLFNFSRSIQTSTAGTTFFDFFITDGCGNTLQSFSQNVAVKNFSVALQSFKASFCEITPQLTLAVQNFTGSFTVKFLQAPQGFIPELFNSTYPGPFTSGNQPFESNSSPIPLGTYEVEVTDGCGKSVRATVTVLPAAPTVNFANAFGSNTSCRDGFGRIRILRTPSNSAVTVEITAAPSSYPNVLPTIFNLVSNESGEVYLTNLPVGIYNLKITNLCGQFFLLPNITVPTYLSRGLTTVPLPSCTSTTGGVVIQSNNAALTSLVITEGPAAFSTTYPVDSSAEIVQGNITINNIPVGIYSLTAIDQCGFTSKTTINVEGYIRSLPGFTVQKNCNTFNILVNDSSTGNAFAQYWLLKQNPISGIWEHPITGLAYDEVGSPTTTNALRLQNFSTTFNLSGIGTYRIIKYFFTLNTNPLQGNISCLDELGQFEFEGGFSFLGAYNFNCKGGLGTADTIVIDVTGLPPYNFSIISKDGVPFFVDNGANNIFTGLMPGTYRILFEDQCTAKVATFSFSTITPLTRAFVAKNIIDCKTDGSTTTVVNLRTKIPELLGNQSINRYFVNYFLSQADADANTNSIIASETFLTTSNPQTIFARVEHRKISGCFATSSFKIYVGQIPVLSAQPTVVLCQDKTVILSVEGDYDKYLWFNGETSNTTIASLPGTYTVTATKIYGASETCSTTLSIVVVLSEPATSLSFIINDWSENSNSIQVLATGNGTYEYSLDALTYQQSNLFVNLLAGQYKIYVRDTQNCGTVSKTVDVLNYSKFFTPNGDSYNDAWKVPNSIFEDKFLTTIFNRFGKLIIVFRSDESGWNGTFDGQPAPADDYWFEIKRQNGQLLKGHFALKR